MIKANFDSCMKIPFYKHLRSYFHERIERVSNKILLMQVVDLKM